MLLLRHAIRRSVPELRSIAPIQSSAPNHPMAGIQTAKPNSATPAKAGIQTTIPLPSNPVQAGIQNIISNPVHPAKAQIQAEEWNFINPEKARIEMSNSISVNQTHAGIQTPQILKFVMPGPHLLEYWNDGQDGDYIHYACKSEEQFALVTSLLPDRKIEFSKETINALLAKEIPIICRQINEGDGRKLVEQGLLSPADFNKLSKTRMLHPSRHCVGESSDQWDFDVRAMNDDGIKAFIDCGLDYSFGYLIDDDMGEFPDNTSLYAFVRNCISHIVAAKSNSTIDETNLKLKRKISLSKRAQENSEKSENVFFDSISFRVTCSRQIKPFLSDYFISRLSVLYRDTGEYVS